MDDTLARRSPLQDWNSRLESLSGSVRISEEPFVTMIDLWVDSSAAGGVAATSALGIEALPTAPCTVIDSPDATIVWFGPQEWLITSTTRAGAELEDVLRTAVAEHGGAAVDVSAQRTTIRLRGDRARNLLAKGCSLDLHPSVFGVGAAAQTMLGKAAIVLIPLNDNGTDYRIIVRSSFARYLTEWLIDAAGEFAVR
jgi:sarcosine oxidase subunit gamma